MWRSLLGTAKLDGGYLALVDMQDTMAIPGMKLFSPLALIFCSFHTVFNYNDAEIINHRTCHETLEKCLLAFCRIESSVET